MSEWELPKSIFIGGKEFPISYGCDYRVIFDCFAALKDSEFSPQQRTVNALIIFYEDINSMDDLWLFGENIQEACNEMYKVFNLGKENKGDDGQKPIMDWKHDWHMIAPAVSRVLHYDVRDPDNYTHWYSLIGAYMEVGDCYWAQVISYRNKRRKGRKMDKSDREFYNSHKEDIDFETELTDEQREWLEGDI